MEQGTTAIPTVEEALNGSNATDQLRNQIGRLVNGFAALLEKQKRPDSWLQTGPISFYTPDKYLKWCVKVCRNGENKYLHHAHIEAYLKVGDSMETLVFRAGKITDYTAQRIAAGGVAKVHEALQTLINGLYGAFPEFAVQLEEHLRNGKYLASLRQPANS